MLTMLLAGPVERDILNHSGTNRGNGGVLMGLHKRGYVTYENTPIRSRHDLVYITDEGRAAVEAAYF